MTEDRARTEILARVRRASQGRPAAEIARELAALETGPPPLPDSPDIATAFLARVLRNGGSVDLARDRLEAVQAVARFLRERFYNNRLVAGNDARLAALPWQEAGVLPRYGGARDGDTTAISYARLGVAETGAVATLTGRANPAAHNLLAEAHLVLVDVGDLCDTLEEAWARLREAMMAGKRPRGVNFIAGPSSTADVEASLVRGAHGPRQWHVILVGDVPPENLSAARALAGRDGSG